VGECLGQKIGILNRNLHAQIIVDPELSMQLIESFSSDIKRNQVVDILELINLTWSDDDTETSVEEKVARFYDDHSEKICHCLYQDKELVGYGESILLTIQIEANWLEILGLGGLNVHPDWRRKGCGRAIVEAIFKRIDSKEYPFFLFQTGIPHFYEKLGCKEIKNKFINSNNHADPSKNPFWDEYVMVYPASTQWPTGTADLRREGF
jgi:predicted N-acetyltransferase YhbS